MSDSAPSPHSPQHQPNDKHEHRHSRPWNRDVSAAINIYLKQYLHAFGPDQLPDRNGGGSRSSAVVEVPDVCVSVQACLL